MWRRWILFALTPLVDSEQKVRKFVGYGSLVMSLGTVLIGGLSFNPVRFRPTLEPRQVTLVVTLLVTSFYLLSKPWLGALFASARLKPSGDGIYRPQTLELKVATTEDITDLVRIVAMSSCNLEPALRTTRAVAETQIGYLRKLSQSSILAVHLGGRCVMYSVCVPVTAAFRHAYVQGELREWDLRPDDLLGPDEPGEWFFCPFVWVNRGTPAAADIALDALLRHVVLFHRVEHRGFRIFGPAVMGLRFADMQALGATSAGLTKFNAPIYEIVIGAVGRPTLAQEAYRELRRSEFVDASD